MNVPGSNLVSIALRVIKPQVLQWQAFVSRTTNSAGDWVSTYATAVPIEGSFQAVNKALYQQLGLNIAKNYSILYTLADVQATHRDREGDLLTVAGRVWQAESDMDWRDADGWRKLLCVEIPS